MNIIMGLGWDVDSQRKRRGFLGGNKEVDVDPRRFLYFI